MIREDPDRDELEALVHALRNELTPARLRLDAARLLVTDSALAALLTSVHASIAAITRVADDLQALHDPSTRSTPAHPTSAIDLSRTDRQSIEVLLIDDHAILADALLAWLAADAMFAPPLHARTAAETWALLNAAANAHRPRLPDIVLLDLHLPDANGLDLCRALRDTYPSLRILLHSGALHALRTLEAHTAGASGVLPKGLEPAALRRAISDALDAAPQGPSVTSTVSPRTRTGRSSPAPSA